MLMFLIYCRMFLMKLWMHSKCMRSRSIWTDCVTKRNYFKKYSNSSLFMIFPIDTWLMIILFLLWTNHLNFKHAIQFFWCIFYRLIILCLQELKTSHVNYFYLKGYYLNLLLTLAMYHFLNCKTFIFLCTHGQINIYYYYWKLQGVE